MTSSSGILQIRLAAIQSNWRYVSARLSASAQCAAVVKANAYGIGVSEVAPALYAAGCRHFFVVTLREAMALRGLLPTAAIYVLGGCKLGSEMFFVDQGLVPILYSQEALLRWLRFCDSVQKAHPCVLKMDTGMTRLGLSVEDLDCLVASLRQLRWFDPIMFMSHLACADEPDHPQNDQQLEKFKEALARLRKHFPDIKASLANSSGTFLGSNYHFDMVRIGAALYGINPQPGQTNPLSPVVKLKLPVLQIRQLQTPAAIGYGATVGLEAGRRLAVVSGGYADGLNRSLGGQPIGEVDGQVVRALGRMSMDSCIFDITSIQSEDVTYIEVINDNLTLDKLIAANKSLGYEVLTSLGGRFVRQYEDADV
jgi:alanine racemase